MQKAGRMPRRNLLGSHFRSNWQLYVIFMLPAFLLTLVFKYFPMGGLIIAFQKYNSRLGPPDGGPFRPSTARR